LKGIRPVKSAPFIPLKVLFDSFAKPGVTKLLSHGALYDRLLEKPIISLEHQRCGIKTVD